MAADCDRPEIGRERVTRVEIANVAVIFGDEPDGEALELLRAGYSKEAI